MKPTRKTMTLSARFLLPLVLAGSPAMAQIVPAAPEVLARVRSEKELRVKSASDHLRSMRAQLGLDADTAFSHLHSHTDEFGHTHARFQQFHRGTRVWGGEIITHMDSAGVFQAHTNALMKAIDIDVKPRVSTEDALQVVFRDMAPKGPYSSAPMTELVIYPETRQVITQRGLAAKELDATMVERQLVRYSLAHYVRVELDNALDGVQAMDYLIDARTGAILQKWSSRETAHAVATGARSQFSGTVSLNTNSTSTGFELRDMLRGTGGTFGNNVVLKYNAAGPSISDIFTDATNTWGDGLNYVPGSTTSPDTYQTPAVDAAFGVGASWDFFKKVMSRNGIDNNGTATYAVVHDSNMGANASWNANNCFCMRFGDGGGRYKPFTALDIAAHELAHGVTKTSANLAYTGEPGGLNEASSDIFGTMVEFYHRGGGLAAGTTTIPNMGGNWTIGDEVFGSPLRYMYKPSKDGLSLDAWSLELAKKDPHYASGPMNRAFYFMSQGATVSGETSTSYLPSGMTGIGNDRAAKIWYRALTAYMTVGTDYVGARHAAITAAKDLHGSGSAEEKAVWNAFRGINVGPAWSAPVCGRLDAYRELAANEHAESCNGQYALVMQPDGNLVLYKNPGIVLWNSGTYNNPGAYAIMQADGNLVVYKKGSSTFAWHTGTYGSPGARLAIQDDGNMVLSAVNGVPLWYVTMPANGATTVTSSGANTSFGSADLLDASRTGIKGWVEVFKSNYFRLTVAAGKTVKADFVGDWLMPQNAWTLSVLNSSNSQLSTISSDNINTRIARTYTNTTGTTQYVYLEVRRNWDSVYPDYSSHPYSIALQYY